MRAQAKGSDQKMNVDFLVRCIDACIAIGIVKLTEAEVRKIAELENEGLAPSQAAITIKDMRHDAFNKASPSDPPSHEAGAGK